MATPAFNIKVLPVNLLALTNEDVIPLFFRLYRLDDEGTSWTEISIDPLTPLLPDSSLPADGTFNMVLADNLYKIFISDAAIVITDVIEQPGYYILADQNIKACKREMILRNLCGSPNGCDSVADRKKLERRLRFHDLEMGLYYIYSNWIRSQAMTMLIVPTNQELLSMRNYLDQLLDMCDCKSRECKQCSGGQVSVSNWTNQSTYNNYTHYTSHDCGCN